MSSFMVQAGGYTADLTEKPTRAPIVLESQNGLKNVRGAVAMARRGDPNSATAQFFINVVDNPNLDHPRPDGHGYAVFGRVVEGMDVVDKIRAVPVAASGPHQSVPTTPVVIKSATIVK
jgi:peptidyl-prolyl cis-trans isomerase A (cyclophilin A)